MEIVECVVCMERYIVNTMDEFRLLYIKPAGFMCAICEREMNEYFERNEFENE